MKKEIITASVIFAAGKGSRMKGTEVNKTLLPLIPGESIFEGGRPILIEIIENLPPGPKALVVNYRKEDVFEATRGFGLRYHEQPVLNGTGGALLAARDFINEQEFERLIITYGDIPLVRPATYERLLTVLEKNDFAVLGFEPEDKNQYGVLEIDRGKVKKITESKYWQAYTAEIRDRLRICNAGIYATSKDTILTYLPVLERHPHKIMKERNGRTVEIEEFFLTDLIEWMDRDGLDIGFALVENEYEVMGVDDTARLEKVQQIYHRLHA